MAKAEALQRRKEQAELLERCKLKQQLAISKQGTSKKDQGGSGPWAPARMPAPLIAGARRVESPQLKPGWLDRGGSEDCFSDNRSQLSSVTGDESNSGNDDGIWSQEKRTLILDVLTQTLPQSRADQDFERSDDEDHYVQGAGISHCPGGNGAVESAESNEEHTLSEDTDRNWAYARSSREQHVNSVFSAWSKGEKANSLLQASNELALALLENASNPLRRHAVPCRPVVQLPCAGSAERKALAPCAGSAERDALALVMIGCDAVDLKQSLTLFCLIA